MAMGVVALALVVGAPAAGAQTTAQTRDVVMVGNNWDGTADVLDGHTFQRLTRFDVVPDLAERMAEIQTDPARLAYFLAIRQQIGEGHDQFVDDIFTSPDGRYAYVSRPSLADVVAFDLATRKIVWRVPVDGQRSDHMALSADGERLLVSASTARVVDVIDTAKGAIVARIDSGDTPHESNFSKDGTRIFHASIGTVYSPLDAPELDATKGDRWFEVIDAKTYKVLKRLDMGKILRDYGFPNMSSAVRPMALSPDERFLYFQVSFFHGFVEFDLQQDKPTRLAMLPVSETAQGLRRDEYVLDSAHHGLAMNAAGTKLCVAGTMSDYAAVVDRGTFDTQIAGHGQKPYWATNSIDGEHCLVSFSGDDRVGVISYEDGKEVASIPVGDHPQRMRTGRMVASYLPGSYSSCRCHH
ncbi:MAG: serine/threonine protein kinase [Conexibacter sp.]|nr:serine/threonine protein kinase [Conexibacter sp.]